MTPPPALGLPEPTLPISRRRLLVGTGLSAMALGSLAACTNYGKAAAPATSKAAAGLTVAAADIPVAGGKIFPDAQAVITQPTAQTYKAFSSICTHQQCPLADVTTTINCNCHGSKFSITDGSVVNGPATTALPAKTVTVSGSNLTVTG